MVLAYVTNVLVPLQVVLVDQAVIVKVPSLATAVIVLDCAGLVFGCVIVITGAVLSNVYVYVFTLLKLFAASHCPTFSVVVLENEVLLRVEELHVGVVPFVVYFIVPSDPLHDTANDGGPNVWLAVHVGGGGGVLSIPAIAGVEFL